MIIKSAQLKTVCGVTSRLPQNDLPEIAFAGRSNVGKSSLINAVLNRKSLARTSSSPGKTQTINFYEINEEFFLVDLPGYGYAKANEEVKAQWGKMIERYLTGSKSLKGIFLLVDIRHEPTANDCLMYDFIVSTGLKPIIIANKLDKINRSQREKNIKIIKEKLKVSKDTLVIPFSALSKEGREDIYDIMDGLLKTE